MAGVNLSSERIHRIMLSRFSCIHSLMFSNAYLPLKKTFHNINKSQGFHRFFLTYRHLLQIRALTLYFCLNENSHFYLKCQYHFFISLLAHQARPYNITQIIQNLQHDLDLILTVPLVHHNRGILLVLLIACITFSAPKDGSLCTDK